MHGMPVGARPPRHALPRIGLLPKHLGERVVYGARRTCSVAPAYSPQHVGSVGHRLHEHSLARPRAISWVRACRERR